MRGALWAGLAAGLLLAACRPATTGAVKSAVVLPAGQVGDLRGALVELRRTRDITDSPAYRVAVESSAFNYRAQFVVGDVEPDSYYVLAWKDVDGDDTLSDGDLVGVNESTYARHQLGRLVRVFAGDTARPESIQLRRWTHVVVTAAGWRSDSGRTTSFQYLFNQDLRVDFFAIGFPTGDTLPDDAGVGERHRDSLYESAGWTRGGEMPTGWHVLMFQGVTRADNAPFRQSAAVFVR